MAHPSVIAYFQFSELTISLSVPRLTCLRCSLRPTVHVFRLFVWPPGGFESFHSNINPEELFRKIFGDAGFGSSGFGGFSDFAESAFGFAPAAEVKLSFHRQRKNVKFQHLHSAASRIFRLRNVVFHNTVSE